MRRQRNTKIVATVGPACSTRDMLKKIFVAGVDVFRLNMSHGSHDEVRERHGLIRGSRLALGRIGRCNPLGGHGFDPVP